MINTLDDILVGAFGTFFGKGDAPTPMQQKMTTFVTGAMSLGAGYLINDGLYGDPYATSLWNYLAVGTSAMATAQSYKNRWMNTAVLASFTPELYQWGSAFLSGGSVDPAEAIHKAMYVGAGVIGAYAFNYMAFLGGAKAIGKSISNGIGELIDKIKS